MKVNSLSLSFLFFFPLSSVKPLLLMEPGLCPVSLYPKGPNVQVTDGRPMAAEPSKHTVESLPQAPSFLVVLSSTVSSRNLL